MASSIKSFFDTFPENMQKDMPKNIPTNIKEGFFTVSAPSNIALIKYWGKKDYQVPKNPSLSFTLKNSRTFMDIRFKKGAGASEFNFDGGQNKTFSEKIFKLIDYAISSDREFHFLKSLDLTINSRNTFPHSTGIASSASSMAALSLALYTLKYLVTGIESDSNQISALARMGSGSASRSILGGVNLWGECQNVYGSSNEFAINIDHEIHEDYQNYGDAIILISKEQKKISSSMGHAMMNNHPYREVRFENAKKKLERLLEIMKHPPNLDFCEMIENEALELHALMMTSAPSFILMNDKTLWAIHKIRQKREMSKIPLCFTLDAGPNIHLLYPGKFKNEVVNFLASEFETGEWIDDEVGVGPSVDFDIRKANG